MSATRGPAYTYLAVNYGLMLLFLLLVLRIQQRISLEQRAYADFGDSLDFLTTAVPVFSLSVIYSLIWGIGSVVEVARHRTYKGLVALGLVAASWFGLILVLRRLS